MTNVLSILLMTAPTEGQKGGGSQMLIMFGLIFVVMYLFMIRPQMKRQKELRNFRSALKKGDKIVTTGGLYGKISEITEQYVLVEIADKVKIKIDKNAVLKDPGDLANQQNK